MSKKPPKKKAAPRKRATSTKGVKTTGVKEKAIPRIKAQEWTPNSKLKPKEELFCRYYVQNEDTRLNGTWSYALAYGYDLEGLPDNDAVYSEPDEEGNKKLLIRSTRARAENVCAVEARRLLRKPQIDKRLTELFNEILVDDIVDRELAKVIIQDHDKAPKVRAIQEYNKLRTRITEKVDHTHKFADDERSTEEVEKAVAEKLKFFKKV